MVGLTGVIEHPASDAAGRSGWSTTARAGLLDIVRHWRGGTPSQAKFQRIAALLLLQRECERLSGDHNGQRVDPVKKELAGDGRPAARRDGWCLARGGKGSTRTYRAEIVSEECK